jgi:hypothetical protein
LERVSLVLTSSFSLVFSRKVFGWFVGGGAWLHDKFFYGFLAGFANTRVADKAMPFSIAPSDFSHLFLFLFVFCERNGLFGKSQCK